MRTTTPRSRELNQDTQRTPGKQPGMARYSYQMEVGEVVLLLTNEYQKRTGRPTCIIDIAFDSAIGRRRFELARQS